MLTESVYKGTEMGEIKGPAVTTSSQDGEIGISVVSLVINKQLGWRFKRIPQQDDFGVDGHIEIIHDGIATGKCLAIQLKYGESYFSTEDDYGYIYYDNEKHLNYFANYPIPVLIVLCHPVTEQCHWELFDLNKTEKTKAGWKLSVSRNQTLTESAKSTLSDLAGHYIDYTDDAEGHWLINSLITDPTNVITCVVSRADIEANYYDNIISFFKRLTVSRKIAKQAQGKVILSVYGYDHDPRELWEIPEVRSWFRKAETQIGFWFYFLHTEKPLESLTTLAKCICDAQWVDQKTVKLDDFKFAAFKERNIRWFSEIAEWLQLSEEEKQRLATGVINCLK